MSYNILADFHHAGLLNSLIMLFEDRFGGKVYRPIGREWFDQGYWKVYDHPATVEQFLGIGGNTPDGSPKLNEVTEKVNPGIYLCHDIDSGKTNKAITLDAFMRMKIDFVIASIPQHIEPFRKLCNNHPNKPKLIYQIGNSWNINYQQEQLIDFILSSANLINKPTKPFIIYHQEFDLNLFKPCNDFNHRLITSFVNCFSIDQLFKDDWLLFQLVEDKMLDWNFRALGGQCRNGSADGSFEVARRMRRSKFIWHTKRGGDGYGHIIHNAFACGKPIIVKIEYYDGKLARNLMKPNENCIAIDGLSVQEIVNKITYYSQSDRYIDLSSKAYNTFKSLVDFDSEADTIGKMLQKLI